MAFATKYQLLADSFHYRNEVDVCIQREGYSGAIIRKKIGANHITLNKEDGDAKIKGTTLDICIQSDANFEFADFFLMDRKQHLVRAYYGGLLHFVGYLVGDEYGEPYKAPPYDVDIVATDGLGLLSEELFSLTGMVTRLEAIKYCLDKVNIPLPFHVSIDLLEERNSAGESMLSQVYFDAGIHSGQSCYDVINYLLPYGTTITQNMGCWLIRRKGDEQKNHVAYNEDGNVIDGYPVQGANLLTLGSMRNSDVYPVDSIPTMRFVHSVKECKVIKQFGARPSILSNYNFSRQFDSWTWKNIKDDSAVTNYGNFSAALVGGLFPEGQQNNNYLLQAVDIHTAGNVTFGFDYGLRGLSRNPMGAADVEFVWELKFIPERSGSDVYWLKYDEANESWLMSTEETLNTFSGPCGLAYSSSFSSFSCTTTNSTGEAGQFQVKFYQIQRNVDPSGYLIIEGYELRNIILNVSGAQRFSDPEEIIVVIRPEALRAGDDIELKPVDLPTVIPSYERRTGNVTYIEYDGDLFFDNGNYVTNNVSQFQMCTKWINRGHSGLTEIQVLQEELSAEAYPKQFLQGTFRGAELTLNSVITHPLNYQRQFAVYSGSWQMLDDVFNLSLVELFGTAVSDLWVLENGAWLDQGKWAVETEEQWNDEDPE